MCTDWNTNLLQKAIFTDCFCQVGVVRFVPYEVGYCPTQTRLSREQRGKSSSTKFTPVEKSQALGDGTRTEKGKICAKVVYYVIHHHLLFICVFAWFSLYILFQVLGA